LSYNDNIIFLESRNGNIQGGHQRKPHGRWIYN